MYIFASNSFGISNVNSKSIDKDLSLTQQINDFVFWIFSKIGDFFGRMVNRQTIEVKDKSSEGWWNTLKSHQVSVIALGSLAIVAAGVAYWMYKTEDSLPTLNNNAAQLKDSQTSIFSWKEKIKIAGGQSDAALNNTGPAILTQTSLIAVLKPTLAENLDPLLPKVTTELDITKFLATEQIKPCTAEALPTNNRAAISDKSAHVPTWGIVDSLLNTSYFPFAGAHGVLNKFVVSPPPYDLWDLLSSYATYEDLLPLNAVSISNITMAAVALSVFGIAFWKREAIIDWTKRDHHPKQLDEAKKDHLPQQLDEPKKDHLAKQADLGLSRSQAKFNHLHKLFSFNFSDLSLNWSRRFAEIVQPSLHALLSPIFPLVDKSIGKKATKSLTFVETTPPQTPVKGKAPQIPQTPIKPPRKSVIKPTENYVDSGPHSPLNYHRNNLANLQALVDEMRNPKPLSDEMKELRTYFLNINTGIRPATESIRVAEELKIKFSALTEDKIKILSGEEHFWLVLTDDCYFQIAAEQLSVKCLEQLGIKSSIQQKYVFFMKKLFLGLRQEDNNLADKLKVFAIFWKVDFKEIHFKSLLKKVTDTYKRKEIKEAFQHTKRDLLELSYKFLSESAVRNKPFIDKIIGEKLFTLELKKEFFYMNETRTRELIEDINFDPSRLGPFIEFLIDFSQDPNILLNFTKDDIVKKINFVKGCLTDDEKILHKSDLDRLDASLTPKWKTPVKAAPVSPIIKTRKWGVEELDNFFSTVFCGNEPSKFCAQLIRMDKPSVESFVDTRIKGNTKNLTKLWTHLKAAPSDPTTYNRIAEILVIILERLDENDIAVSAKEKGFLETLAIKEKDYSLSFVKGLSLPKFQLLAANTPEEHLMQLVSLVQSFPKANSEAEKVVLIAKLDALATRMNKNTDLQTAIQFKRPTLNILA